MRNLVDYNTSSYIKNLFQEYCSKIPANELRKIKTYDIESDIPNILKYYDLKQYFQSNPEQEQMMSKIFKLDFKDTIEFKNYITENKNKSDMLIYVVKIFIKFIVELDFELYTDKSCDEFTKIIDEFIFCQPDC